MFERRLSGGVNLLHLPSRTYLQVQRQIFDLVAEHLPPHRVTRTVSAPAPDRLNWVLHIRAGRYDKQVPTPGQVVMSHGLADKSYLFVRHHETGEPLLNSFEHVLVPGQWHRHRILERAKGKNRRGRILLGEDNVHVVGWPRLDPLVRAGGHVRAPVVDRPLRLLWAPSHDNTRIGSGRRALSSYPAFEEHLPRLQQEFDVRVSLHPRNRSDKAPTQGAMAWADIVIGDFGTTLYEGWALDKCVIMPTWLIPPDIGTRMRHTAEAYVYRTGIGNHAGSIDELIEMAHANEAPDRAVKTFMDDYLEPQHLGTSARRIAQVLDSLAPPTTTRWGLSPSVRSAAVAARRLARGVARRLPRPG